jgi:hypothetical protein
MNSLLSNLGSLLSQIQPNQAGLNAGRIAKEVSKTNKLIEPIFDKAAWFDSGRVGRMDFKLKGNAGQVYMLRVYATGDLTGVLCGLTLMTARNSDGKSLGTDWSASVDTDREMVAILATGKGPQGLLENTMLGGEGEAYPEAPAAIRQLYRSASFIREDIPQSLTHFNRQALLCQLPNERASARLWDALGFTIKDYREGFFFRSFEG